MYAKYRLYCETEETMVFTNWTDSVPIECPNNSSHTIDSSSISRIQIESRKDHTDTREPNENDDILSDYGIGSIWTIEGSYDGYYCADSTIGNAVWQPIGNKASDKRALFYAYDNTGNQNISNQWTDINFNILSKIDSDVFTYSSGIVEFLVDGLFKINYGITIDSTNNSRSKWESRLMLDSGSGFEYIRGSNRLGYSRNAQQGGDSTSATILLQVNSGDKIKVQAYKTSGGASLYTYGDGCSLYICDAEASGEKGDKGDAGSGSTIVVEKDDSIINSSTENINFEGNVNITDEGNNKVTVNIPTNNSASSNLVQFSFVEEMDYDQYLISWVCNSDRINDLIRSGDSGGLGNQNCCPILIPYNATIKKAIVQIKGGSVSTATPDSIVNAYFELWNVGWSAEGTKISDIIFPIDSTTYQIGSWWNSNQNTDLTMSISLNININEGDRLGLKYNQNTGSDKLCSCRNTTVSFLFEERM